MPVAHPRALLFHSEEADRRSLKPLWHPIAKASPRERKAPRAQDGYRLLFAGFGPVGVPSADSMCQGSLFFHHPSSEFYINKHQRLPDVPKPQLSVDCQVPGDRRYANVYVFVSCRTGELAGASLQINCRKVSMWESKETAGERLESAKCVGWLCGLMHRVLLMACTPEMR